MKGASQNAPFCFNIDLLFFLLMSCLGWLIGEKVLTLWLEILECRNL